VSPILGIFASAQQSAFVVGDYESIATVNVGAGGSATVTFSSIPSTYTHLQLRAISRDGAAGSVATPIYFRWNSNTSNYAFHYIFGNGTSASGQAYTGQAYAQAGFAAPGSAPANVFGAYVMDILDYANTNKNKTFRTLSGYESNSGNTDNAVAFESSWVADTTTISSITIFPGSGNIAQYSSFALYGIKG
jgi:hypothetical protein